MLLGMLQDKKYNRSVTDWLSRHDLFHVFLFVIAVWVVCNVVTVMVAKQLNMVAMVTTNLILLNNLENIKLKMLQKCKCIIYWYNYVILIWVGMWVPISRQWEKWCLSLTVHACLHVIKSILMNEMFECMVIMLALHCLAFSSCYSSVCVCVCVCVCPCMRLCMRLYMHACILWICVQLLYTGEDQVLNKSHHLQPTTLLLICWMIRYVQCLCTLIM